MPKPSPIESVDTAPLPFLLGAAKQAAFEELHRRLVEEGYEDVRGGHGCVFRFVGPEGMRLTELSEAAEITKQACGEIVDELEDHGYVERAPDAADRRAKLIRLTPRGIECQRAAMRVFAEIERDWAERLGAERIATLRAVLEELREAELASALAA